MQSIPDVNDLLEREWTAIYSENWRTYMFPNDEELTISHPAWLHVDEKGAHRILTSFGVSWYIPAGWLAIRWSGNPHFVK